MRKNIGCNAHHFRRQIGKEFVCMYCGDVKENNEGSLGIVDQAIAVNSSYKYVNVHDNIQMAWLNILAHMERVRLRGK